MCTHTHTPKSEWMMPKCASKSRRSQRTISSYFTGVNQRPGAKQVSRFSLHVPVGSQNPLTGCTVSVLTHTIRTRVFPTEGLHLHRWWRLWCSSKKSQAAGGTGLSEESRCRSRKPATVIYFTSHTCVCERWPWWLWLYCLYWYLVGLRGQGTLFSLHN